MDKKRIAEYYIYKDKNTGNIQMFIITDGVFKIKKSSYKNISNSLEYIINTANYVENVNLYSNTPLSNDEIKLIKNAKNIFYRGSKQEHPLIFRNFLIEESNEKIKNNYSYLTMNIFKYQDFNLLGISIKINEFNKTSIKIIKENVNEEALILNYIKDIIPFKMDNINKEQPIVFRNKNKDMIDILERNKLNDYIKTRIDKVEIVPFDEKKFINDNFEMIDSLIKNYINNLLIKDEVKVNYEDEKDKNKLVIYTDASTFLDKKNNINDSGCGIVIRHDISDEIMFEINRKFKPDTANFDANYSEGNAILEALKFVKDISLIDKETKIEIRSDSISNIRKLNDLENHYKVSKAIVDFCRENLKDIDIEFKWVKGHSTYQYNVMADDLASSSLFNTDFDLKVKENTQAVEDFKNRNHNRLKMRR